MNILAKLFQHWFEQINMKHTLEFVMKSGVEELVENFCASAILIKSEKVFEAVLKNFYTDSEILSKTIGTM